MQGKVLNKYINSFFMSQVARERTMWISKSSVSISALFIFHDRLLHLFIPIFCVDKCFFRCEYNKTDTCNRTDPVSPFTIIAYALC